MSIKIEKVMSEEEFEMILKLARARYQKTVSALDARQKFIDNNEEKLKAIKEMVSPDDKKLLFTNKLINRMLEKADELLAKELGDPKEIILLTEFLKKFEPNSKDVMEIDITFLNKKK